MNEAGELYSVGIDIGTTTTQIIFSRLLLEKTGGFGAVPAVRIAKKTVVYKSPIHFTPLLSPETVDAAGLKAIVSEEYRKSGVRAGGLSTGAVIITGESARKGNARQVAQQLAELAGNFVVCTAGPDYEAVLAGRGAGAGEQSRQSPWKIGNFDIGGGTTNTAVFQQGEVKATFALDIGGRLVKVDSDGLLTYVSEKIKPLAASLGLSRLRAGEKADIGELERLTRRMAGMFPELAGKQPLEGDTRRLFIGRVPEKIDMDRIMFSGGVSEYIYGCGEESPAEGIRRYGDIGPLLGASIRRVLPRMGAGVLEPKEKIRATVVGAGSYSMEVSGSTVTLSGAVLPMKNIPVLAAEWGKEGLTEKIRSQLGLFEGGQVAVSLRNLGRPGYGALREIADQVYAALAGAETPIVILTETDCAKALGLLLSRLAGGARPIVCLDQISAQNGDYVDIGNPVCGVVPVVVKTLIFG